MHRTDYAIQRTFLRTLPHGDDLLSAIETLCREEGIVLGTFSVIGAVASATYGYYDQQQRRYKKLERDGAFELISCSGNVSIKDDNPFIHAHILFGDEKGSCFGGHLMSPTKIFAAELLLQELDGERLVREHDETTGLFLWK